MVWYRNNCDRDYLLDISIRVNLNIIQIGAELIQIILAYLLLTRKFSKLTTFGLIMIIGIVTTVAIFC